MTTISINQYKKWESVFYASMLFIVCCSSPFTFASPSPAVQQVLDSSFALKDQNAVIASLVSLSAQLSAVADKKAVFSVLADYEERLGLTVEAAKHFNDAALADPSARDDALLLDSARCALSSNDVARADGLVRAVLLTCFDEKILLRARVYAAWILLSAGDTKNALPLFRTYSRNPVFIEFTPALLFTLWWTDSDQDARSRLLSSFPLSPEAAIIRGEMSLSPSPFWYLMGRNDGLVTAFAREGNAAVSASAANTPDVKSSAAAQAAAPTAVPSAPVPPSPEASAGKVWQQVGFFKNREYADELVAQLKKQGFQPIIRNETRPSGTVYLSVLVPEDASRSVGPKLKDAGFESFLLID